MTVSKARNSLPELVNRAAYAKERTILSRHGKEVAAVVPIEDLRRLEEEEDRRDLRTAKRRLAKREKSTPLPALKKKWRMK